MFPSCLPSLVPFFISSRKLHAFASRGPSGVTATLIPQLGEGPQGFNMGTVMLPSGATRITEINRVSSVPAHRRAMQCLLGPSLHREAGDFTFKSGAKAALPPYLLFQPARLCLPGVLCSWPSVSLSPSTSGCSWHTTLPQDAVSLWVSDLWCKTSMLGAPRSNARLGDWWVASWRSKRRLGPEEEAGEEFWGLLPCGADLDSLCPEFSTYRSLREGVSNPAAPCSPGLKSGRRAKQMCRLPMGLGLQPPFLLRQEGRGTPSLGPRPQPGPVCLLPSLTAPRCCFETPPCLAPFQFNHLLWLPINCL